MPEVETDRREVSSHAAAPDAVVLKFEKVDLRFGETVGMDNISFEMRAGETRMILGAAGSGKTTLLKTALGLLQPDQGHVFLYGRDITGLKERELFSIRSKVGVLFQEGGLFDSMTVEDNVAYPLVNRPETPAGVNDVDTRVREALRFVELEQTLDKFPSELSGGMRRRAAIARAVVTKPPLLLYDSPTAGLDPITAYTIMVLIIKERDLDETAALVVSHRYQDGNLVANFRYNPDNGQLVGAPDTTQPRTKFMVMREGRLVFEGSQDELEASEDTYIRKLIHHKN